MPTLIAEKTVKLEFEDLARRVSLIGRPAKPPARAAGVHQSGILQYVAQKIGVLKPGESDEEDCAVYPLIWGLGQAWEEWIFSFYPDIDWQPGEVTIDGISGNADGVSLDMDCELDSVPWDPIQTVIEEAKSTYKSTATGDEFVKDPKWWMWRMQGGAYCFLYGAEVVRWHVAHLRGNYRDFGPVYKQYVLRYSPVEIRQVWTMLISHKHLAAAEKGAA